MDWNGREKEREQKGERRRKKERERRVIKQPRRREGRAEERERRRQRTERGERLDVRRFNQRSTLSTPGVGGRHPSADILGGRDMKNDV